MIDKHASRIGIFNETLEILKKGWYASRSGLRVQLPGTEEVMAAAKMYREPIHDTITPTVPVQTEVRVENKDCVLAARDLIDAGFNPAMLNLADLITPGGLVEYGSGAQEENLCRRSNLVLSLYQFSAGRVRQYPDLGLVTHTDRYPMDERSGGIYSGIVTFFRGPESDESRLDDKPYNIPVISVAAICCPRIGPDGMMINRDAETTLEKIRTIFRIGMANGHDSLVLSAFGCGAFANPPSHIAKLFHQVMEEDEFKNRFKLINFAILDGYKTGMSHNPEGNLMPFKREFGQ